MTDAQFSFLQKYLNTASPTGAETAGQQVWLEHITPAVDKTFTDAYGSAVAVVNPDADYKVVLEAHADEIAWYVNYISDSGYIYVTRNGGSDHQIAPSKRVNIYTEKGVVKGVFGWPAIHVRNAQKEEAPTLKNIFVDVGASSKDEVEEMGVHVGCILTFDDELIKLNDKYICGRALDNRMGGYMIAQVAHRLKAEKKKPDFGLYFVNSVQEEIGLRGAQMIAQRLQPDVALVTDVCHDTSSPMYDAKSQGDTRCGEGPVFTYNPAVHPVLRDFTIGVAKDHEIPFQRLAKSRGTGTDTDSFAYSHEGVPSVLVQLPLKYMHTTVETVAISDVDHVVELMYQFVSKLEVNQSFKLVK